MHIRCGMRETAHDILLISTDKYMVTKIKKKSKATEVTVFLTLPKLTLPQELTVRMKTDLLTAGSIRECHSCILSTA